LEGLPVDSVTVQELNVHSDERGWVSEIYSGIEDVELRNIHLGTMKPGAIRGNHVHRQTREWISFLEGPVEVCWREDSERIERELEDPSRIYLPPETPHAFRNPGNQTVTFAAYTDTHYREENPDARPVELLDENR